MAKIVVEHLMALLSKTPLLSGYDIIKIEVFPGLSIESLIIIGIEKLIPGCTFGLIYLKTINIGGMIIS